MCRKYGLQLAIIDNISLLERLQQLNMCRVKELFLKKWFDELLVNATCKGQCPKARGYYIGLKRLSDKNNQSQWIWSNNVTWTQNETDVWLNRMTKAYWIDFIKREYPTVE